MSFMYNNQVVDTTVDLWASLKLYLEGDYRVAISQLISVLDDEPKNWQARLLLSACYYRTGQYFAAQRGFRFLYDNCPEKELKHKSFEALQASQVKMVRPLPPEFGCDDRKPRPGPVSWLDAHTIQKRKAQNQMKSKQKCSVCHTVIIAQFYEREVNRRAFWQVPETRLS